MDDIYFSDKRKKNNNREPASSKRITSDKFLDSDYDDESFELDFSSKGKAQSFKNQGSDFKVELPDFDIDIPEPKHIEKTNYNIYSSASRTPQGKRVAPGEAAKPKSAPTRPVPPPARRPAQTGAASQGQRPQRASAASPQGQRPRAPQGGRVKKKRSKAPAIIASMLCLIILAGAALLAYGYSALGGLDYDDSITENKYLDESTLLSDPQVRNILFIGSDAREGLSGQRSDSMILFSIDNATHQIKLTSFLRDSYVYIPSKKYHTKLNAAFSYGGAQLLMETLEYNFGVEIDEYVMVNYEVFIDFIDLLGGITIKDVTEAEAKFMREEVNRPKFKKGTNHVDGRTAMWYCRIRYLDNDFRRTERQRKVITSIISKATKTNPLTLVDIVKQVLPNIATNIERDELFLLGMGALLYMRYDIVQQQIPAEGTWYNDTVYGQYVLKMDFDENKEILEEFIYG